ncbi:cell division protein PerM [Agrococcus sediminis]|uniref:cell division protein PerM n=1 Tax=Agrococcus sediminis TaxID=2599924 RepID=UPI003421C677
MRTGPAVRRLWAGIGQAVESAAIVAVGIVLCALVLLAVWGIDQGFAGDPSAQWRVAVDAWLLGHGVAIGVTLGTDAIVAVGIEEAGRPFVLSLGAWGIGLVTFWLHWRSGRRLAELPLIETGIAVAAGALATGLVGLGAAATATHGIAAPNLGQAFAHPALVALAGMLAAVLAVHGHDWLAAAARGLTIEEGWMRAIRTAIRSGLGGAAGVLGAGALVLGAGLVLRFTDGILLMEALQVSHVGVVVLFLVQLALLPVAVVWAASWAIGPGFMIGTGSSISPLGTDLGPVPSLPLLAAIDPEAAPWMLAVVALPVLAGVLVGVLARQTMLAGTAERPVHWWELAIAGVGGGVLAGALLGVAAMLATGSAGPGRLAETGPDAVLVAAWGALEVGAGLLVGMAAGGRGAGALAGIALPLAGEREGSRVRDLLGFGAADAPDARDEAADAADGGEGEAEAADAAADASADDAPVVAPSADEQETAAIAPLADAQETAAIAPLADAQAERAAGAEPTHPEPAPEQDRPAT